ncbi:MAG: acetolactate synthase small subunit [Lachnospira sp.]|nr:acetolactate synthase small subunit [Lachnospira sp.]
MRNAVFSILVENSTGVLSRVSGLFTRRGYNIESITAGYLLDEGLTRITIATSGDDAVLEQIQKQLAKLIDVKEIRELPSDSSVIRELMLIKVRCDAATRKDILSIVDIFRANIVDAGPESMIIEITGEQDKLHAFIELLRDFKIEEIARTGITALERGASVLK